MDSLCTFETAYFAILFLIHSINALYLEESDTQDTTPALRRLFVSTLHHWVSIALNGLLNVAIGGGGLNRVLAVEILRSPFILCVPPNILTSSIVMYC